jgi:cytochrome c553
MERDRPYAWSNAGFRWSVIALVVLTVLSFLVGLVVLPAVHKDFTAAGLWEAICRAAGVPARWEPGPQRTSDRSSTDVVVVPALARTGGSDAIGRGATIALQQCSMCHGAQGTSAADTPNLAGQYPEVVYKQMQDYKRGYRGGTFMQTIARNLSDGDIADLASYYNSLPKARTAPARYSETTAPALVRVGDPLRNIAPCISCHGGTDHKLGAPWLEGMPRAYLVAQLRDFKTGVRRNDSHAQMRNMTRAMTDGEIVEVAEFYARREKGAD